MKVKIIRLILSCTFLLLFFSYSACAVSASNRYGGSAVFATTGDPKSFNDIIAKETSTTQVTSLIFEGLTTVNAHTLRVEPHLAKSWEISDVEGDISVVSNGPLVGSTLRSLLQFLKADLIGEKNYSKFGDNYFRRLDRLPTICSKPRLQA